MDIHAPLEPVHTWKDVAIHLSIMTIGLFIALMLEAGVEYWHHRNVVAEARANIRQEIEENHEAAEKDLVNVQKSINATEANVKTIHAMMAKPKNFHGAIENSMSFNQFHDAAWRTARDTGALSYMPYDEVQRYSDVYVLEQMVSQKAQEAAEGDFRSLSPVYMGYDMDALPESEYMDMLRANASAELDLVVLKQYVQQFDDECLKELKH